MILLKLFTLSLQLVLLFALRNPMSRDSECELIYFYYRLVKMNVTTTANAYRK